MMKNTAHRGKAGLRSWVVIVLVGVLGWPVLSAEASVPTTAPAQVEADSPSESPAPATRDNRAGGTARAGNPNLITNMWVDTELREILQDISAQTGVTIIPDQSVHGAISLAAEEMPLEECLERLCAVADYSFARVKNYYVMGRAEPGTPLFRRLADFHRVKLKHTSTEQVKSLLPSMLSRYVTYDKTNGVVLVTATEAMRRRLLDAINLIDSPNQQIAIEVLVFELTEDGSKQLGLDWQYSKANLDVTVSNLVGTITFDASDDIATYIDVTLRAIIQDKKGRVLANPRIVAMNGKKAEIFVGQEKYFSLLSGQASNPYYRLESIKSGVMLTVTPHIGRDGQIVLDLAPEVSDVMTDWTRESPETTNNGTTNSLPVVTRRWAETSVSIKDGQTVVIGGLLREQHRAMVEKVPLLGDLPILGAAFRKVRYLKTQQEVFILITTHLISDGNDSDETSGATALQQRYVGPLDAISVLSDGENPCSGQGK